MRNTKGETINNGQSRKWLVLAVSVVLAAMGCWFCWNCPMDWLYGTDQHIVFKRQVLWNAMGIVLFVGASQLRWKWWRKSAPWLFFAWLLLAFYTAFFGRSINGTHRWVDLGFVRINIRTVFILVSALFAAWLCMKKYVRPWMIIVVVCVCCACYVVKVVTDGVRLERITSFFDHQKMEHYGAWMHYQLNAAFGVAKWVGNAEYSVRFLPNPLNDGMASASALLLGRWFPLVAFGLLALLGGLLSAIWLRAKNVPGRMFLLFWGIGMLIPAVYGFFQCVGFVPPTGCSPVLVGYGGTGAVVFWLGLGVVFSFLREEDGAAAERLGVVNVVCWGIIFVAFCLGVANASLKDDKFYEPQLNRSDLGEFGTQAQRGEILAADGSALAQSCKIVHIHLDPKAARMEYWESPQDCYRAVAECLGLSESFVSNQYANTKSRYIKLVDVATPEMVSECMSNRMRRGSGLVLTSEQCRRYPLGTNAVHVVGCIQYPVEGKTTGCTGLEYVYNSKLAGVNGEYDPDMKLSEKLVKGRPENGGDVITTILPGLQVGLSETLGAAVARGGVESGWGIVLKVPTGEIEAMASVPAYNPIKRDKDICRSHQNNAVQMLFEPGGLMKPITYAITIDNWAVAKLTHFGFGRKVGGETLYSEAVGCDTAVTGIQMVNAYAVFANDGVEVLPHLVSRTTDVDDKMDFEFLPRISTKRVISAETAQKVSSMMEETFKVVVSGAGVDLEGMRVAGAVTKSAIPVDGCCLSTNYNVAVVGFLQVDKPEYVVSVGFLGPKGGRFIERVALLAFKEVIFKLTECSRR